MAIYRIVRKVDQLRASWVASVVNLDWPSTESLTIDDAKKRIKIQKEELICILDEIKSMNMNAIVFQIKPCADALYRSNILPWSQYLTGVLGKEPGFDPLAYVLKHAHARKIEVHAWLNPYRVSMNLKQSTIDSLQNSSVNSPSSVFKQHRQWVKESYNRLVLDPGIPEVRKWVVNIRREVVINYDIDGIQFDDYFYYEAHDSRLDDDSTYEKYGVGFSNKGDWRRNNTYSLVKEISQEIKKNKPQVQFGISPECVWRNKADDILG